MIALLEDSGRQFEYLCDSASDVSQLPNAPVGSTAMVVDSGDIYVVNTTGAWVKFGG